MASFCSAKKIIGYLVGAKLYPLVGCVVSLRCGGRRYHVC